MTDTGSFLQELEDLVSRGSPGNREKALNHATDLLIAGRYSDDQIWIFGEVIERLAREIETATRSRLATRLANTANAPSKVVNRLASDDSIEVAAPVLRHSQRIDARTLLAVASSKGQQHLLAISQRKSLSAEVTDQLVARGNREVVNTVAANPGAHFSSNGFMDLVRRSETDSILAENLGVRRDIPRHLFQQLIAKASAEVRRKLESERPDMAEKVGAVVADATGDLHSKFGPATKQHYAAKKLVLAQQQNGGLREAHVLDYARSHRFEEATIALSLLCGLPIHVVERALTDGETLLILVKALGYSWDTATALLFLGASGHRIPAQALDDLGRDFARLDINTARGVLASFQARKSDAEPPRRLPERYAR